MIKVGALIMALFGCVYAATLTIDKNTSCGDKLSVDAGKEYIIKGMGESPGVDCPFSFTGQMRGNCFGLCYNMERGSFFRDVKANLQVKTKNHSKIFTSNDVLLEPWCSDDMTMSVTLKIANNYVFDPKNPGFDFSLAVYNKCGQHDSEKSISFEEAIKNLENYHHGEEFHDKVRMNMVQGILVGCCLACVFLILLLVTYCYYKHSPNRGRSRSVGMPKIGFSKKMDVKKDSKKNAGAEPEAYKYTPTDPERVERQPESKPLLKDSADPEKPPAEAKFDPSVDP